MSVFKIIPHISTVIFVIAAVASSNDVRADDLPFVGNYTQNVACKGDGSSQPSVQVKILAKEIDSNVGPCTVVDTRKDGETVIAHVECKFPAGPLMGEISFTPRPDNDIDFVDRDGNYKAVLHRCPN